MKTKENINFIIDCAVYPFQIWFFFGKKEYMFGKIKGYFKENELDVVKDFNYAAGKYIMIDTKSLIWLPKIPNDANDYSKLQHEIFHAVYAILGIVGMKLSDETEEAFTYLTEYITREVYNKLWQ